MTINVIECVPFQWCSSVQTLCSGQARQELIIVEAVSKGFAAQGFVWPFAQHTFISSISVLSRPEGIWFRPARWSRYYATDSGQWKPYYDLFEPVVGYAVHLREFSYVSFLHFYGLSFTNPWLIFSLLFSFSYFYLFIDTFLYLLFEIVCVCVFSN